MGDARKYVLKVDFDPRLRLEFHGAKVTSDAALLAKRGNRLLLVLCTWNGDDSEVTITFDPRRLGMMPKSAFDAEFPHTEDPDAEVVSATQIEQEHEWGAVLPAGTQAVRRPGAAPASRGRVAA